MPPPRRAKRAAAPSLRTASAEPALGVASVSRAASATSANPLMKSRPHAQRRHADIVARCPGPWRPWHSRGPAPPASRTCSETKAIGVIITPKPSRRGRLDRPAWSRPDPFQRTHPALIADLQSQAPLQLPGDRRAGSLHLPPVGVAHGDGVRVDFRRVGDRRRSGQAVEADNPVVIARHRGDHPPPRHPEHCRLQRPQRPVEPARHPPASPCRARAGPSPGRRSAPGRSPP